MKGFVRGALWILGILFAVALLLHLFLFDLWTVPRGPDDGFGTSILPTLRSDELVLVQRGRVPRFGELARCLSPLKSGTYVVGRVFGVQGDRVEVGDRGVITNGSQPQWRHVCPSVVVPHPVTQNLVTMNCTVAETGAWSFEYYTPQAGVSGGTANAQVEPGKLYLVSDNRLMHEDSRDFGQVDASTCEHVVLRLWGEKFTDATRRFDLLW